MLRNSRRLLTRTVTLFAVLMLFLVLPDVTFAKSGKIVGMVVNAETGEPVIGATVMVKGTQKGGNADVDGNVVINRVEPGEYTLVVSAIGYNTMEIEGLTVEGGKSAKISVTMKPQVQETGKKIKVTAKALRNSEAGLIIERIKAPSISDAISAQNMSRAGAGDAASAMERVTGASTKKGKVIIRGLGGRYGLSLIDGVRIPTTDPEGNTVSMNLFPTDLLDNISVAKTFTPDKPGNFSGGAVNLRTKDLPEQMTLTFSSSVKYNSEASLNDNFISSSRSSTDWLGMDDGMRSVPEILEEYGASDVPSPNYSINRGDEGFEEMLERQFLLDSISQALNSSFKPIRRRSPLNQSYAFSFGNNYSLFGRPVSLLTSFTYGTDYSYYDDGIMSSYTNVTGEEINLTRDYLLHVTSGTEQVSWGGLAALNFSVHQNHKLGTRFIYTREAEQEVRHFFGEVYEDGYTIDNNGGDLYETRTIKYIEEEVRNFQLFGEHFLKPFQIEWKGAITQSSREEPNIREFSSEMSIDSVVIDTLQFEVNGADTAFVADTTYDTVGYTIRPNHYPAPSRYFRDISEDNYEAQVDFELPLTKLNGQDLKIKFGGSALENTRQLYERYFQYIQVGGSPSSYGFNGDPDWYLSDEYNGMIGFDSTIEIIPDIVYNPSTGTLDTLSIDTSVTYNLSWGAYPNEQTDRANDYEGITEIYAGYLMTDFSLLPKLKVIGGARFEKTTMTINTSSTKIDPEDKGKLIDEDDLLPSASLIYALNDKMNLRLAYGKTLARPNIRELSPMVTRDFVKGRFTSGNSELKRTLINNYDFRWEWFSAPGEIMAVSAFYKKFENPIELAVINTNLEVKYFNVDEATTYGMEFEFRKNLGFMAGFMRNFSFEGNLTLLNSEVDIPEDELALRRLRNPDAEPTRQLAQQSEYIINANLNYYNYKTGTDVTLLFNVFGERIVATGYQGVPDIYEQPSPQLDLTLSQKIMSNLKLKGSVKNILGSDYEELIHANGEKFTFAYYTRPTLFSIGLSYSL